MHAGQSCVMQQGQMISWGDLLAGLRTLAAKQLLLQVE
jgi:hypothetical protein